jgi:Prokaryotic N-terminal methylation motif
MLHFFAKRLRELHEKKRDERGFTLIELLVVAIHSVREGSTISPMFALCDRSVHRRPKLSRETVRIASKTSMA